MRTFPLRRTFGAIVKPPAGARWSFSALSLVTALLVIAGVALLTYPTAASWVSQYNQSNLLFDQTRANSESAKAEREQALADAKEYNSLLESGAMLRSGANVAEGVGSVGSRLDYWNLLAADPTKTMARLSIPAIDVDLPVYHGTSEATLLKGVGHLEGTSLPVGGKGTRSVLTGHRGLASATMFTDLDKVKKGDTFSVDVLGEVFTYKVFKIEVIDPGATEEIRPVKGKDLMTLITCTPLGINSHRILITGERITPTPAADIEAMQHRPTVPGPPWWILFASAGILGTGFWYWRSGYAVLRKRGRRGAQADGAAADADGPAADSEPTVDPESAAEPEPSADLESAVETEPSADLESAAEAEPEAEPEPEAEAEPSAEAEPAAEPESVSGDGRAHPQHAAPDPLDPERL